MSILGYIPWSSIVISVGLGFMLHSAWNIYKLTFPPTCNFGCLKSSLVRNPTLELYLFTSVRENPVSKDVSLLLEKKNYLYYETFQEKLQFDVPYKTRKNGTLFLHMFIIGQQLNHSWDWDSLIRHQNENAIKLYRRVELTKYALPPDKTVKLMSKENSPGSKRKPVTHIKTLVEFNMLTDVKEFPRQEIPVDLYPYFRLTSNGEFLPIVTYNILNDRHSFLKEIKSDTHEVEIQFKYSPVSYGKLRLMLQVEASFKSIALLGFSDNEMDDVKSLFADTDFYLLLCAMIVSFIHLLFDFLAFKNDIGFWKSRKNTVGISVRSVIWRTFSQIVIFLYLLNESASYLVLIPNGISGIIEVWKLLKLFKFDFSSWFFIRKSDCVDEKTSAYDHEAMRYLSYVLYPLCILTAIYSYLFNEHKSVYSWVLKSMVNSVYAFGFIFMLPQLFINYKLKSVAHLPWKAFMYKAFNTFIDDFFVFLITVPTMHRLACFRDDIIFLIYLYQRWIYPVDKRRLDRALDMTEESNESIEKSPDDKKRK